MPEPLRNPTAYCRTKLEAALVTELANRRSQFEEILTRFDNPRPDDGAKLADLSPVLGISVADAMKMARTAAILARSPSQSK